MKKEITVHELSKLRELDKDIQILDIREDSERDLTSIAGTIHIKLTEIAERYNEIDKNKKSQIRIKA